MKEFRISPRAMISSLWCNRSLARAMTVREVVGRYRGSVMGMAWSFFNPLLMLLIYTFVFSVVFGARSGLDVTQGRSEFAMTLFVGMMMHGFIAECLNRAPGVILSNVNYVKKVIFPLDILPWVAVASALFHMGISLLVLLLAKTILTQQLDWAILLFPFVLLPLVLMGMGISWFLAGLGVYIRDIGQVTGMLATMLLFLSPVFYSTSILPEPYQGWLRLNPLAFFIEEGRNTLLYGKVPDMAQLAVMMAAGTAVAWLGFAWFQKVRKGFADVL